MFDWGAEQMSYYLGEELGELLIITLNNAVEATLAIILLVKCELRLLQTTIVGVVILHLLMIPGTAFLVDGMRVWQQELSEHSAELNHSLLLLGIMAILLPTAFFAALDRGYLNPTSGGFEPTLVNDSTRDELLRMSRGLSVLLLIVYVCSRIFIHTTSAAAEKEKKTKEEPKAVASGQKASMDSGQTLRHRGKSDEVYDEEKSIEGKGASNEGEGEELAKEPAPRIGPGVCFLFLVLTVGLMAVTAEFLVESVEFIRDESGIQQEWFGLILLPNVSFAADGVTAVVDYFWTMVPHLTGRKTQEPERVAKARAIDLSIQFALFWMPLLVLLGWWISKPMHLLFDYFELALLLGACFLVNYVTADAKTNWVEGLAMVVFYIMIAICAWFYPGQPEAAIMLTCPGSVAGALATNVTGSG
ncbi:hypothetical protein CERSUDRAFT_84954 [Gelatoporia subvermispora B]|uniref:Sodium/calcium exchanger membrane region domain-containing protein n=1 Tax=Ceriporiopsis subvermispora (strain B) TaxID=914234 RepID=M2PIA6_CERS8|nr:hypothetical protein CERSUDRAFT_84954 [Gelatoporia subvermispora B]